MADLGFSKFNDMIGQINFLDQKDAVNHWKATGLDFTKLFYDPDPKNKHPKFCCENQDHYLDKVLAEGANKAEEIAGKKIKEMKKIIGF